MPETNKITLTELSAWHVAYGEDGITKKYSTQKHFLIVPPAEQCPPPLLWTPNLLPTPGTTAVNNTIDKHNIPNFAITAAVVVPIEKRGWNDYTAVRVGRSNNSDIRITSKLVSKLHAFLFIKSDFDIAVRDMRSTNGTYINGHKLRPEDTYSLRIGNELKFGDVRTMYVNLENLIELVTIVPQ